MPEISVLIHHSRVFVEIHLGKIQDVIDQIEKVVGTVVSRLNVFGIELLRDARKLLSTLEHNHHSVEGSS